MLLLKPNCECCNKDLPPESDEAMICSFECTFCTTCIETIFSGACPNCGGDSRPRPTRTGSHLENNPASTKRVLSDYVIQVTQGKKTITRHSIS